MQNTKYALALIITLAMSGCNTWQRVVRQAGYHPLRAPTTDLPLGSVVVIWDDEPVQMQLVCAASEFLGSAPTPTWGQGPTQSRRSKFEAALTGTIRESQNNAGVSTNIARSTTLRISELRYGQIPISTVFARVLRSPACVAAIRHFQNPANNGGRPIRVSVVTGVYEATVDFDSHTDIGAQATATNAPGASPDPCAPAETPTTPAHLDVQYAVGLNVTYENSNELHGVRTAWGLDYFNVPDITSEGGLQEQLRTFAAE